MNTLVLSAKFDASAFHISKHFHDCHQLIYVVKGSAGFVISERTYTVQPGTLVLISRFEQHALQWQSEDYCRYNLRISPETAGLASLLGDNVISVLTNRPDGFCHAIDMSGCSCVESLLKQIILEYTEKGSMRDKLLNVYFSQLLLLLCRHHPELITNEDKHIHLIRRIQYEFETNYGENYSLDALAASFHISQSYLCHLFRRITGQSIMAYLMACRLTASKHYLTETDLEIGQIVEKCGFSDNSNFSRSFKAATGSTPSQFRKRYRKA